MSKRKRAMSWVLGKVYMEWEKQDQNRTVSCSTTKLEREKQTAKNTEKKGKIGQLSSLGPGLYWFWQLINVGAEVRTTMNTWVWHGLKHCWGLCLGDRESPHVASKIPTAFIWPKAPARESVDMHLLWDSGFRSVLLNSGLESNSVPWLLYSGREDTQASFYLSFFFFFLFLSLPLPSHLNWLGDKNPAGYTWLALKLISELLQKWLENRSGLTWISLHWGTA